MCARSQQPEARSAVPMRATSDVRRQRQEALSAAARLCSPQAAWRQPRERSSDGQRDARSAARRSQRMSPSGARLVSSGCDPPRPPGPRSGVRKTAKAAARLQQREQSLAAREGCRPPAALKPLKLRRAVHSVVLSTALCQLRELRAPVRALSQQAAPSGPRKSSPAGLLVARRWARLTRPQLHQEQPRAGRMEQRERRGSVRSASRHSAARTEQLRAGEGAARRNLRRRRRC